MASPGDWMVFFVLHLFIFSFLWFVVVRPLEALGKWEPSEDMMKKFDEEYEKNAKRHEDDYWEEEVNYATGEVGTNTGPSVRHPKNRDRAYSGSVERFHDGGGQDS